MDDEVEVGAGLELRREVAWRGAGLEREDGPGGHVGHDERVGMLVVAQRSGMIPVQVEGGWAESRPARYVRGGQVGFGPAAHVGVDGGSLAEGVLKTMMPAPLLPMTSAATWHRLGVSRQQRGGHGWANLTEAARELTRFTPLQPLVTLETTRRTRYEHLRRWPAGIDKLG